MTTDEREMKVVEAFATLADTLVDGYDVVELLQTLVETCVEVLDVDAAGIMLANDDQELEVVASTSETSRLVEVLQLDAEAGPCMTSFATGRPVACPDITDAPPEWAAFRTGALALGIRSVHAVPLRLRTTVIGTLKPVRRRRRHPRRLAPPHRAGTGRRGDDRDPARAHTAGAGDRAVAAPAHDRLA